MSAIFSGVETMARALDFHLARQNMLAANVANVDTPGYAPKELSRPDSQDKAGFSLSLAVTQPNHIPVGGESSGEGFEVHEEHNVVPGNDLNYVSLDHEMSRIAANAIRFKAVGKMVSRHLGMLQYAASDGRG